MEGRNTNGRPPHVWNKDKGEVFSIHAWICLFLTRRGTREPCSLPNLRILEEIKQKTYGARFVPGAKTFLESSDDDGPRVFFLIFQIRFKRLSFEGFCLPPVHRSGGVADKSISSGLFTSVHARVKRRRIILSTNKIPRLLLPFGFGDDSENFCVPSTTRRYENPVNPEKIRSGRSGVNIYSPCIHYYAWMYALYVSIDVSFRIGLPTTGENNNAASPSHSKRIRIPRRNLIYNVRNYVLDTNTG